MKCPRCNGTGDDDLPNTVSYGFTWPTWLFVSVILIAIFCALRGLVEFVHDIQRVGS